MLLDVLRPVCGEMRAKSAQFESCMLIEGQSQSSSRDHVTRDNTLIIATSGHIAILIAPSRLIEYQCGSLVQLSQENSNMWSRRIQYKSFFVRGGGDTSEGET